MSPKVKLYDKLPWTQGLVLDLPLYLSQMGSAGKVLDRTRYHNNGIVTGALWGTTGRTFAGDGGIATGWTDFDVTSGGCVFEAWVKTSSATIQTIIGRENFGFGAGKANGDFQFRINADGSYQLTMLDVNASIITVTSVTTGLNDGVFHHLVGSWSVAAKKLYLITDGVQEADTAAFDLPFASSGLEIFIGRKQYAAGPQYFTGTIGEVRIYQNRFLPLAEIKHNNLATKWRYI